MKLDVVVAGVGGQGTLLVAGILARAGLGHGLTVKQGELHGMSQRGGSVRADVRLADGPVASDVVPRGAADLVLGLEPLEALRHAAFLAPGGHVVTSLDPVAELDGYPTPDEMARALADLPSVLTVPAGALAREAGSVKAANVVVLGAAAPLIPVPPALLLGTVLDAVAPLGEKVVEANRRAFALGLEAGRARFAEVGTP